MPISEERITIPIQADGDSTARWRVCLHEAGHSVAGRVMLKRSVKAIVYDDNHGAAYLDIDDAIPRTYGEALAVAAGPAAEALANEHVPPPHAPPATALTTAYPESTAPLVAQMKRSPTDAMGIARWCIGGFESHPDRWVGRFNMIHRDARILVARHQTEIIDVATGLFTGSIVTLPAEPAPERAHSDNVTES